VEKRCRHSIELEEQAMTSAKRHLHIRLAMILLLVLALLAKKALAQLATTAATLEELPELRSFAGRIEAAREATVSAETSGRVEEIRADIGDVIAAGTVILTVTSTEQRAGLTRAEAALAEARATLVTESAEVQRARDLFARQFMSQADMDRATQRFDTAQARVDSMEAALRAARAQLSYTEVRAPYSGVVSARLVEPGELVQPGTPLMSGYDPAALRVEVDLPQLVAERVRALQEARIVPLASPADPASPIAPAKLLLYPQADAVTSTVRARLELPASAPNLYPGQFVTVQFTVGARQVVLVPQASVVHRSEVSAVYVVRDGIPMLRQVRLGAIEGESIEVLAGLAAGEQIATDPIAAATALSGASGGGIER
jgi:RND family efflux transporter MFP subunit